MYLQLKKKKKKKKKEVKNRILDGLLHIQLLLQASKPLRALSGNRQTKLLGVSKSANEPSRERRRRLKLS